MHRLGRIENITDDGKLLIMTAGAPRMGTDVYCGRNQFLGKVISVIGPVRAPYVIVRPNRGRNILSHVGKEAYMR